MINNILYYVIFYLIGITILVFILKNNFLFFFVGLELLFLAINLFWIIISLQGDNLTGSAIALILIALAAIDAAIGLSLLLRYFSTAFIKNIQLSEMIYLKG